jgi:hypothetical protein
MTMSPRDRVLNNELVTNKVSKVKFNSIHDFLEMIFIKVSRSLNKIVVEP